MIQFNFFEHCFWEILTESGSPLDGWSGFSGNIYQSHPTKNWDAIDTLETQVEQTRNNNHLIQVVKSSLMLKNVRQILRLSGTTHQIKNVPAIAKILSAERGQFENCFQSEKGGEHFVSQIKDVLQLLAHAVVLDGQEDGVEDDAEGDDHVEEGVVDDGEENVLGLEPTSVVETTSPTASTVPIVTRFWKSSLVELALKP